MASTIDVTKVPATVVITNASSRVKNVQLYRINTTVVLTPGDVLKLNVATSNELIYFLSLQSAELTVETVAEEKAAN